MATGRKRKIGIKRTASGRASRAGAEAANLEPILTRMRMFGLSEKDARDQKASTFVGRLQLQKVISAQQYDAAVEYLRVYDAYKRAIKAPDASRSSGGVGGGDNTVDYERWCHSVIGKYDGATEAIRSEQNLHENRGSNLYAAIDYIVCRDEQQWHMVGDCRLALNALAHHFGLMSKKRKAQVAA